MLEQMPEEVIREILDPLEKWYHRCHAASLEIVKHPSAPDIARVARGWLPGCKHQHSWVCLGDPYSLATTIIDPTIWSYMDNEGNQREIPNYDSSAHTPMIVQEMAKNLQHIPYCRGSIRAGAMPAGNPDNPPIALPGLSSEAQRFLNLINPEGLDVDAWYSLLHAPVEDWPSGEIIAAAFRQPQLTALIPIDIVGMRTDLNPGGFYLRDEVKETSQGLER